MYAFNCLRHSITPIDKGKSCLEMIYRKINYYWQQPRSQGLSLPAHGARSTVISTTRLLGLSAFLHWKWWLLSKNPVVKVPQLGFVKHKEEQGREMHSIFRNYVYLLRLFFVLSRIGNVFLYINEFRSVIQKFVYGDNPSEVTEDSTAFATETESLLQLCPALKESSDEAFKAFHDFTVNCGQPLGTVLVSERQSCRKCSNSLTLDKNKHVVVIYHQECGTYLGSRLTKLCRKCKIYEHYGFWTQDGKKYLDANCLKKKYMLSTEDTAFDLSLLKQCGSLLIVGAVAFSTFTASYNRRFQYLKKNSTQEFPDKEGFKASVARKRLKR